MKLRQWLRSGPLGAIGDTVRLLQLPKDQRRIVFYSEGKTYWVHLEALLRAFLDRYDIPVCYLTSGIDDPGLTLQHPRLRCFKIDEGAIRNWLFENIDTDVMVMTMPDIHQYQVKRSRHPVHYVYTQHSLVSKHMVYRPGAFDHYDSIFCAGPHHVTEMQALIKHKGLPPKSLVEHGYARLDSIIANATSLTDRPGHRAAYSASTIMGRAFYKQYNWYCTHSASSYKWLSPNLSTAPHDC